MYCISCGREIEDGSLFCRYCGIRQQEIIKTGDKVFSALMCTKCGAPMKKNADDNRVICSFCGATYSLEENAETVEREENISIDNVKIHVRGDDIKQLMENTEVSLLFGEFTKAQEFCDKLFVADPDNENLYKYQLLIDERCSEMNSLSDLIIPFDESRCYGKILQTCEPRIISDIDKALAKVRENGSLTAKKQLKDFLKVSKSLSVGDTFEYGFLGLEPIKWEVISKSDYAIGAIVSDRFFKKKYSSLKAFPAWTESELRQWLNEDFPYLYFNDEQRERLCSVSSEILRETVHDKVSLLSIDETEGIREHTRYRLWGGWSRSQDYESLVFHYRRYASEDDRNPEMGKMREIYPYIKLKLK